MYSLINTETFDPKKPTRIQAIKFYFWRSLSFLFDNLEASLNWLNERIGRMARYFKWNTVMARTPFYTWQRHQLRIKHGCHLGCIRENIPHHGLPCFTKKEEFELMIKAGYYRNMKERN